MHRYNTQSSRICPISGSDAQGLSHFVRTESKWFAFASSLLIIIVSQPACEESKSQSNPLPGESESETGAIISGVQPSSEDTKNKTLKAVETNSIVDDMSDNLMAETHDDTQSNSTITIFSNLQKVDADGRLTSVVNSTSLKTGKLEFSGARALAIPETFGNIYEKPGKVSKILIAKDGKVYILFSYPQQLFDIRNCLLARIESDGTPLCIDSDLGNIEWNVNRNPAIQFDSDGGVYYSGTSGDGKTILRRWKSGEISNLISDSITLTDYFVQANGSVILMGGSSTGIRWLREIKSSGGLKTITAMQAQSFLMLFPDGNLYFGGITNFTMSWAVSKINTSTSTLDERPWIGDASSNPYFDCSQSSSYGFRGYCGASIVQKFSAGDSLYVVAGWTGATAFMKYFPTVEEINTGLETITTGVALGQKLLLTGLDINGLNKTVIFDLVTEMGTAVASEEEYEVYSMVALDDGEVMFNGLRFSDNKKVVGKITISPPVITVLNADAEKFIFFERIN